MDDSNKEWIESIPLCNYYGHKFNKQVIGKAVVEQFFVQNHLLHIRSKMSCQKSMSNRSYCFGKVFIEPFKSFRKETMYKQIFEKNDGTQANISAKDTIETWRRENASAYPGSLSCCMNGILRNVETNFVKSYFTNKYYLGTSLWKSRTTYPVCIVL